MSKNLRELVWIALLPATLLCMLPSCGGGGGDNALDQGIRPSSLNGVTLNFGGAIITFSSPAPNTLGTGTETGGMFYEQINDTEVQFTPTDPAALDGVEFHWPFDIAGTSYYEYRPIDGSSGLLTIYPESTEGGLLDNSVPGSFDTIVLTFTASGGSITGIEILYTLISGSTRYSSNAFTVSGTIGGLSANPRPIPTGWNGVNDGPGFLADPSFVDKILVFTEAEGDVEIALSTFNATLFAGGSSSTTERGTVAVTFTIGLLGDPLSTTVNLFEANYTLVQLYGTEDVVLTLDYTGTFFGDPLPPDDNITMTFTGGGILTPDIQVLYGTHVRTGGSGTFVLSEP